MYDYYFKSEFTSIKPPGHRHDWEHIAVWVQNGQLKFISVSQHGHWEVGRVGQNPQARFEAGTHPKVVYHKDGISTHAFGFAGSGDEPPENHWQSWRWGAGVGLIEWKRLLENRRQHLNTKDRGSTEIAIRNKNRAAWDFGWYPGS